MTFDAWNAVDFFPSGTLSGIGDSLMPAVEGLASDVQAGAGKLTELAEKVPNAVPDERSGRHWRAWPTSCAGGSPGL